MKAAVLVTGLAVLAVGCRASSDEHGGADSSAVAADEVVAELESESTSSTTTMPECGTDVVTTEAGSLFIEPNFTTQGDAIWQTDPDIDYGAEVTFSDSEVTIEARIVGRESGVVEVAGANTGATGSAKVVVYEAPPEFRVVGVRGTLLDEGNYVDSDEAVDELPGSGPVSVYEISGQTPGADVQSGMQAIVHYVALEVDIVQDQDCAP